jgi:hypothetical protein
MARMAFLGGAAMLGMAAAPVPPSRGFNTTVIMPPIVTVRPQVLPKATTPPGFDPAPLPDQDAFAPVVRPSGDASVSPGLFTRKNQYHGEGLPADSSVQAEQDRRAIPGAGLNLSMPLQ